MNCIASGSCLKYFYYSLLFIKLGILFIVYVFGNLFFLGTIPLKIIIIIPTITNYGLDKTLKFVQVRLRDSCIIYLLLQILVSKTRTYYV